jgi:two-component system, NtrC family, response regulator AtoC
MKSLLVFVQFEDPALQASVQKAVLGEGHTVKSIRACKEVLSAIEQGFPPDLLVLEPANLVKSEIDLYGALLRTHPKIKVALVVRPGDRGHIADIKPFESASIITKPVLRRDLELLLEGVLQGDEQPILRPEKSANPAARWASPPAPRSEPLVEELDDNRFFLALAPSMLEIYRQVRLLQDIDASVLILGESGTGKEIIAHLLHKHSRRAHRKFVNVNCAALPMDLLESELFGHVKGAFTGAISDKPGRFEQAGGGTLLLDEIGEISRQMQAKLLHVLQDGQFTRLGAKHPTRVDVHVLAATNISIEQALATKTFREDLFYRLNTFTINVPPLRERSVEIPYLVNELIARAPVAKINGITHFSGELMELLPLYTWPGNLRELKNFVMRTLILQDERAARFDLELKINKGAGAKDPRTVNDVFQNPMPMQSVVRDVRNSTEKRMIEEALQACAWNRRDAARSLNISYRALLYKIQQHGLNPRTQRVTKQPEPAPKP